MNGDISRFPFRPRRHYAGVWMQQGRVQLDADWNEAMAIIGHHETAGMADTIGPSGGPESSCAFGISLPEGAGGVQPGDFRLSRGHYYVDGILCEVEADVLYSAQPHLPDARPVQKPGHYLVYLDVWQRPITHVEDPEIREKALGGPDTTTRTQTVWQVRLKEIGDALVGEADGSRLLGQVGVCRESTGKLSARASAGEANSPLIAPGVRYTRLENQLYRVQIHKSGDLGTATFKWSRENGAMVVEVKEVLSESRIRVSETGRDAGGALKHGQWIELVDEQDDLLDKAGQLVQITAVDGDVLETTGTAIKSRYGASPALLKARRWDFAGESVPAVTRPQANQGFLALESGVEVRFEQGWYEAGDFWLIPARSLTGDVEWPRSGSSPAAMPPVGVTHHYAPLAILQASTVADGSGGSHIALTEVREYRVEFPSLAALHQFRQLLRRKREINTHVTQIRFTARGRKTGLTLGRNMSVQVPELSSGIAIDFDRIIAAEVADDPDACTVTVEMPFPLDQWFFTAPAAPGTPDDWPPVAGRERVPLVLGYRPLRLPGRITVEDKVLYWRREASLEWLEGLLAAMATKKLTARLRVRLLLRSRLIWSAGETPHYLDGDLFGEQPGGNRVHRNYILPSGDGQRGGDLEVGFWLVPNKGSKADG